MANKRKFEYLAFQDKVIYLGFKPELQLELIGLLRKRFPEAEIEVVNEVFGIKRIKNIDLFNTFGSEGWELINNNENEITYWFKREIVD